MNKEVPTTTTLHTCTVVLVGVMCSFFVYDITQQPETLNSPFLNRHRALHTRTADPKIVGELTLSPLGQVSIYPTENWVFLSVHRDSKSRGGVYRINQNQNT